jgi:decaprenylphospho-beta-D-ribofuranose 2-oxidase
MNDPAAPDDDAEIATSRSAWVQRRLEGLGGVAATQLVSRPDRLSRLLEVCDAPEGRSLIARGGGQGRGDAALNDGGAVVVTTRLDRMLSFDAASGLLVAEAGVTVGDILRTFLPRGFLLPACPSSGQATVGGAIATDVHGADHVRVGAFGAQVAWLDLTLPRHGLKRLSPTSEPSLFEATIGGMGLTGVIARAAVRLAPVASSEVEVRDVAVATLEMLVERLVSLSAEHGYVTAWLDAGARGLAQERGVVRTADMAKDDRGAARPGRLGRRLVTVADGLASVLPSRLRNERRYRQARGAGAKRCLPLERFLLEAPLDTRHVQLHCVLPTEEAAAAIRRLLDIARRGGGVGGARAQAVGVGGLGPLSFARPGIGLAVALPAPIATPDLMRRLEREILDRGGRVFLADDAHLTDHGFAAMYPRLESMRGVLAQVDSEFRLQSNLARRVRLRDYVV